MPQWLAQATDSPGGYITALTAAIGSLAGALVIVGRWLMTRLDRLFERNDQLVDRLLEEIVPTMRDFTTTAAKIMALLEERERTRRER